VRMITAFVLALIIPVAGSIMTDAPVIWPVSTLIYNLGLFWFFATTPTRSVRLVTYNIFAAGFFIVESSYFFSYYLQNSGFNDAFFYHLRQDLIYAGLSENLAVLLLIVACLIGFLALASLSLVRNASRKGWFSVVPLGLLAVGLYLSPPANALILYAEKHLSASEGGDVYRDFPELKNRNIAIDFTGKRRPNIVLIYAESLEQRYFDERIFPGLLPSLSRLKEESVEFTNVAQGVGAGWTVGGMVASQCGYPLTGFHGIEANDLSIFDEFLPNATCLGDLLRKDGYRLAFVGGADARFAGKGDFLQSHGYLEILDLDDLTQALGEEAYLNEWGVYDDAMFDVALEKFSELSQAGQPFLLTLLTLDPHGPHGYLSKSCEPYDAIESSSLDAFHCSDQLIAKFIEQVRSSPYSENTLVIVLSDHLAMRNQATPLLQASQHPGRLTFFINTPQGERGINTNPGLHYDIAPTILDFVGYDIEGQLGFCAPLTRGDGYLPGRFGKDGWGERTADLLAIGQTLWDNSIALDENGIRFLADDLSLVMGGRELNLRSWGFTYNLGSTLFVFDAQSLVLEHIQTFPFDRQVAPGMLGKELLRHKEKLVLVFGLAKNLAGFAESEASREEWVYFFGKPGSDVYSRGPLTEVLIIPYEIIRELSGSELDERVIQQRKKLTEALAVKAG